MNDFELIPAIDILGGKCVRLTQGDYEKVENFSDNPIDVAKKWIDCGVNRLHLVDLDGAKDGFPVNKDVIIKISKSINAKVEVGGGIRTLESIKEYINEGISYIILGTKAFQDKSFLDNSINEFGSKIIVGLDLKNNKVALSGWKDDIAMDLNTLKEYLSGVSEVIYTDISKDGMLSGPNFKSVAEISNTLKSKIIVSGGIASIENISELISMKKKKHSNISGVILGKSLYKGTIELKSAVELVKKELSLNS